MRCRQLLVRPRDEGRHVVVCGACGEEHLVVVVDDRMVIAGLTDRQKARLAKRVAWALLWIALLAGAVFVVRGAL